MSNYYSERLERFLTPGEVDALGPLVRRAVRYAWHPSPQDPASPALRHPLYGRMRWVDPFDPKVILVHMVSDAHHDIHLYVNETEVIAEEHRGDHDCIELIAVKLAEAFDAKIDERRVSISDLINANQKVKRPWSILDFSETVDWPTRGEIEPHKRHLSP